MFPNFLKRRVQPPLEPSRRPDPRNCIHDVGREYNCGCSFRCLPGMPCEANWQCLRCSELFRVRPEGSREVPYGPEQKAFIDRWGVLRLPYDPVKGKGAW